MTTPVTALYTGGHRNQNPRWTPKKQGYTLPQIRANVTGDARKTHIWFLLPLLPQGQKHP